MNYTDKQQEDLFKQFYDGSIDPSTVLPESLYMAIGKHLEKALYEGYGKNMGDTEFWPHKDYDLVNTLRNNLYMFSGAKTYQQSKDMAALAAKANTFSEFKKEARKVYDQYNVDWLKAEYNTAVGQAVQANQWSDIEADKELFPYVRYVAVMDKNTSEICRPLDGMTLPVDHPLWNKYTPLNHFNCRCILEKIDKYEKVKVSSEARVKSATKELNENVDPEFKMNPGKDGYIFSPEHPYFEVAPKDKAFAKSNFNLPIPPPPPIPKKAPAPKPAPAVKPPAEKSSSNIDQHKKDVAEYVKKKATPAQLEAVKKYTGNAYRKINTDLREGVVIKQSKYGKEIIELNKFLDKAPKFTGEAFRGLRFSDSAEYVSFMKKIKQGGIFSDPGFMSSSWNEMGAYKGNNRDNVQLIIKSKTGVSVEAISTFPDEEEILFNKITKFEVEKVTTTQSNGVRTSVIRLIEL